uniref:Retrovirus-related Pol polyprotein from transposon TNT 1-94 n=1 Tax=Cannabis sativa TaxID=3483 RepID=A0A803PPQ7_CANSA
MNVPITRKSIIACSSTEFEYRALAQVAAKITWLESLLKEIHFTQPSIPVIWCDNMSANALASNPVYHARTKHIKLDVHFFVTRCYKGKLKSNISPLKNR